MKLTCFIFICLLCNLNQQAIATVVTDSAYEVALLIGPHFPRCRLFRERPDIQKLLSRTRPKDLFFNTKEKIQELIELCQAGKRHSAQHIGFIYPGTKWCGEDNEAHTYEDLGRYAEEDKCCREHDHCAFEVKPNECVENMCNYSEAPRKHCGCDLRFRTCLRNLATDASITLSVIFFNNVNNVCIRKTCSGWSCLWRFEKLPIIHFEKVKHYHAASLDVCEAPTDYCSPEYLSSQPENLAP